MDLIEINKPSDCEEDCDCKDCEMRTANDNETIFVSVSPRTFELPKGTEKEVKMKIKNKNPYPIYFRASTSNMDVFEPSPHNGCIPPHSKASLDVRFYDSAIPLRRHEEVIVFTSAKPFEKEVFYKERVCPYCLETFETSKKRVRKTHSDMDKCVPTPDLPSNERNSELSRNSSKDYDESSPNSDLLSYKRNSELPRFPATNGDDSLPNSDLRSYKGNSELSTILDKDNDESLPNTSLRSHNTNSKQSRYSSKDYAQKNASHNDDFEVKPKVPKQKLETEYESKSQNNTETKKIQEDYKKEMAQKTTDYEQKYPKKSYFDEKEYKKRDYSVGKNNDTHGSHEFQEVCIHAQVHQPFTNGCKCTSCVELYTDKVKKKRAKGYLTSEKQEGYLTSEKQEGYLTPEKQKKDRGVKSEEDITEDRSYKAEKDSYAQRETKDQKVEGKGKGKKAHVLARILSSEDVNGSLSDTNLSIKRSRDVLTNRTKIITEEDFKKEKEMWQKEIPKRHADESEKAATAADKDQPKESDDKITTVESQSTLKVLDEKCNTLIKLSWVNLFFMFILMLTVAGGFAFCCSSGLSEETSLPCLFDILKYFG